MLWAKILKVRDARLFRNRVKKARGAYFKRVELAHDRRSQPAPDRLLLILASVALGLVLSSLATVILLGSWPSRVPLWLVRVREICRTNPPWVLISGIAATPPLVVTWWLRTTHKDQDIQQARRDERSTRFFESVKLLADRNQLEARLGALYSLEALARDAREQDSHVIETICAFVRARGELSDEDDVQNTTPVEQSEDIETAMKIISRMNTPDLRERVRIDLNNAQLEGLRANNVVLSGALLNFAHLPHARLISGDFQDARMVGIDLFRADLRGANLTRAILTSGRLCHCNLRRAKFAGTQLGGADLTDTDFSTCPDLKEARVSGAIYNGKTRFPGGFDPVAAGMLFTNAPLGRALLDDAEPET